MFASLGGVDDFFDGVSLLLLLSSSKCFRIVSSVNSIFFKIFRSTDFSFISSIIGGFPADIGNEFVTSDGIVESMSLLSCSLFATFSSDAGFDFVDCSDGSVTLLGASLLDEFCAAFDDDDDGDDDEDDGPDD